MLASMADFVQRHGVRIGAMLGKIGISMNEVRDFIRDLSADYDVDMAAMGDGETGGLLGRFLLPQRSSFPGGHGLKAPRAVVRLP
jgi:hypothetical protein